MKIPGPRQHPLLWSALAALLLVAAATAAWRLTPLSEWLTAGRIVRWIETFSSYWWAPLAIALVYTPASVVMFPRPLLTVAAAIAFGPWEGFAVALGGVLVNTLVAYTVGRRVDRQRVERWGGERVQRVMKALRRQGFAAVATVCAVPIAPFFFEVVAFGALRLELWHVLAGVTVSNLPGLLAGTLVGDQLHAVLSQDRTVNRWIIAAVVAMIVAMGFATRRLWKGLRDAAGAGAVEGKASRGLRA